ncbi:MAG TPA: tyrosine-type recombinase/integrase [Solirubrobacteraceae bacterium]|jgi:integrase|nr:tyrosine-type recombinase/integrase [Solirubrobacteraceae bacterium]
MSYRLARGRYEVRWRDGSGRHRSKRFRNEEAAKEFDGSIHDHDVLERSKGARRRGQQGGVYSYETFSGTRWRYVARRSDGSMTSKRGFSSETAARTARRRTIEKKERGEVVYTRETFGSFFPRWLNQRKPYLSEGTWSAYERDGRLRLLPALAPIRLSDMGVEHIRLMVDELVEAMEAGDIAAKTINNTLGTLVVALNAAAKDRLMVLNPALEVPRLPPSNIERDYLRLHEIPVYLDSCSELYRPVAEVQVGAGLRISETLSLRKMDLELSESGGLIIVYATKSRRMRSIEVGRGLAVVLKEQLVRRAAMDDGDDPEASVFVMPVRTRKMELGRWSGRGNGGPMDRTTVSRAWHKAALQEAALRDMPLHALRHTAAAAWLAAGNSLMYVQRQLGHSDIRTTERYYGHLERNVLAAGATATEEAIARAVRAAA